MTEKATRLEKFRSEVGSVLRELKTEGRVSRKVARSVRRNARKIPVTAYNTALGWFRDNLAALQGVLPEGGAMQAAKLIFGKEEAETRVRLPLLIQAEVPLQIQRREIDAVLAGHLVSAEDLSEETARVVRNRRFWFRQICDCQGWLELISTVVPLVDDLRAKATELESLISLYDQEIQEIKERVRNAYDFTVTELESMDKSIQAAQAQKAELYEKLNPILLELARQGAWLQSAEAQLGQEAALAFEGLLRMDRTSWNLVEEIQRQSCRAAEISSASVKAEARIAVARRYRDRMYVESDVFKRAFAKKLSQAAEPKLARRRRA